MINPSTLDLNSLPWLPLDERSAFPKKPCIYFAIDSLGNVQYIGRTVNAKSRWDKHHKYSELISIPQVKIAYLFVDRLELLPSIEEALIDWFKPALNTIYCCQTPSTVNNSAAKRRDPNYMQLTGDVKKELGLKFKAMCTLNQLAIGEGLEQAIALWLEQKEKEGAA